MGIYTALPENIQEVDVIIAGGGTAGCIVASRLADADPELSILVIESGRDNYNEPTVIHPVLWRGNYAPDNPNVYWHKTPKEKQLSDRESFVQVANLLGGGSSVNLMMYMRPQQCDFDSWGMKGWTADELWPFVKKLETYHGTSKEAHHGYSGPIQVSSGPYRAMDAENDFIDSMSQVGYTEVEDLQNVDSIGVTRLRKYVSPEGKRQDVAHTYFHPRLQDGKHPNLNVLVESQVVRVTFNENRRASGVEVRPNPVTQSNPDQSSRRLIKARKLVVVSSGTLGTPPILERSGVGNPSLLKQVGIPLVADLPGVGHGYQDHHLSMYSYKSGLPPESTTDGVHGGTVDIPTLLANNDKILGWNGIDTSSKIRPTASEVDALGSKFKEAWDRDFRDTRSKPLASMFLMSGLYGDRTGVPPGKYFTIGVYTAYPYSRGHVHITGPDLDDELDFKTGYLTDNDDIDLKTQIWAYKIQRKVAQRMKAYRGEISDRHPTFPPGSKTYSSLTTDDATKSIEYTPEDDAAIEQWVRQNLNTCWHGLGTCKMAPQEKMGVVDEKLGVYGVHGLKIADLSIVPENICANTMNTAAMIGEKAADIFIEELRLRGQ
ncbi:alcohol oxidase-like protein [Whalleya microplaca]|nr:alcohol oxidase-like protein [Whalleya microplaca]